jgi:hypothetical protein
VVYPHPGATSTNSSYLLSSINRLQSQSHQNPYSTQDRRCAQLARSSFLVLQHQALHNLLQGPAISSASLLQSCTKHLHTLLALIIHSHHIDALFHFFLHCLSFYLYIQNRPKHGKTHGTTSHSRYILPKTQKGSKSGSRSRDICFVLRSSFERLSKSQNRSL